MTTRADLRLALRRRLEDTAISPIWDDAVLDDALAAAIREYGGRFPTQRSTTVVVSPGATSVFIPAVGQAHGRIVRVTDDRGALIPRSWNTPGDITPLRPVAQAWRWWEGSLELDAAATGGEWRVEYLAAAVPPNDDGAAVDVPEGDESLLIDMATLTALHHRAIEDGKRGHPPSLILSTAAAIRAETNRNLRSRMRQARGEVLTA